MPDATPVSTGDIERARTAVADDPPPQRDPLAPGGIPPDLQERMLQNAQGLIGQQQKYMKAEEEAYKKLPPVPTVESGKLGKIPPAPQNDIRGDAMAWLGFATALGGLAGAMTKNSSMNALAAFSGTLDGLREGNQQKFNDNFKTWEANARATQENNKAEMDGYRNILDRQDLDEKQRSQQLEMWATQNRNKFMIDLARASRNDPALFTAALDSISAHADKGNSALDRVIQYREAERQRQQDGLELRQMMLTGGMGMAGLDQEAQEIADYRRAPYTPAQTKNNPRAAAIMDQVYQNKPDYDARQYAAGAATERGFAAGPLGQRINALNTVINHLDYLDRLGDALDSGQVQRINEMVRGAQRELGYALPNTFPAIKQVVLNEVISAIVPSGGSDADRQQAQKAISLATTKEQLHDLVKNYKGILAGRLEPMRLQYEQNTGRKDFDRFLTPAAKGALQGTTTVTPEVPNTPANGGATQGNGGQVDPVRQRIRSFIGAARGDTQEKHSDADIRQHLIEMAKKEGWSDEQLRSAAPRLFGGGVNAVPGRAMEPNSTPTVPPPGPNGA